MRLCSLEEGFVIDLDAVSVDHYRTLLPQSTNQRKNYYKYLHQCIIAEQRAQTKRKMRRALLPPGRNVPYREPSGHIDYGLWCNNLLLKINDATISKWDNSKYGHRNHCNTISAPIVSQFTKCIFIFLVVLDGICD